MIVELRQAAAIEILQVRIGAGEREIDVIEHVGVGRSRLAGRARHQPFGERGDGVRVVVVEERAMMFAADRHRHIGGRRRGRRVGCGNVMFLAFGQRFGHEAHTGGGTRSERRADQERTAAFIMLGHDFQSSSLVLRYRCAFTATTGGARLGAS
jgi:hypothetical protein